MYLRLRTRGGARSGLEAGCFRTMSDNAVAASLLTWSTFRSSISTSLRAMASAAPGPPWPLQAMRAMLRIARRLILVLGSHTHSASSDTMSGAVSGLASSGRMPSFRYLTLVGSLNRT
jgi:hypothetical protein